MKFTFPLISAAETVVMSVSGAVSFGKLFVACFKQPFVVVGEGSWISPAKELLWCQCTVIIVLIRTDL